MVFSLIYPGPRVHAKLGNHKSLVCTMARGRASSMPEPERFDKAGRVSLNALGFPPAPPPPTEKVLSTAASDQEEKLAGLRCGVHCLSIRSSYPECPLHLTRTPRSALARGAANHLAFLSRSQEVAEQGGGQAGRDHAEALHRGQRAESHPRELQQPSFGV